MKTSLRPPARRLVLAAAFALCPAVYAASVSSESIRDGEVKQQQVQSEASGLSEQLDAMIAEYARNGLGGDDVNTVKALRDSINRMSTGEMQKVVGLLDKARSVTDAGEAKKQVSDAYAAQKNILVQMKRLLADHLRNQQALELSNELSQLADRQTANLQNGIELGKWAGGKKPENFEAALQAHLEGQKSEQSAIGEELKILTDKIAAFAKDAESVELTDRFQKGVDAAKKLEPATDGASDALKAGQLFKAVTEEKTARDALRKLARDVAPAENPAEALRQAERELEKMAAEQKELAANAAKTQTDFDQWLQAKVAEAADGKRGDKKFQRPLDQLRADKRIHDEFENLKREKANELASLDDPQGDLANKTDLAAQDLDKNAPAVAQAMKGAEEKMQEARAAMADQNAAGAAKNAAEAAAALDAAHAQVAQLAGQNAERTPEQAIADSQRVKQDVRDLAQREAAAAANPDKTQQAALAQQAQQLAQAGAAVAPLAAADLQMAAADAQKAVEAAQAGQIAQAGADQQAAAQALARADQVLTQQVAQQQQARQELAAVQQATDSLKAIIKSQQTLERDTAKATAEFKPKMEDLFKGQNDREQEIQTRTGTYKATISPDLTEVLSPLTDATIDMGSAKDALDKPEGQPADDAEKKALADLYRAEQVLEQKKEAEEGELGEQPQPDQGAAEAAQQAAKAAAAVAQAIQKLQDGALQPAGQQLTAAAAAVGDIAANTEIPQAAQEAAQQATQNLSQAAAQAAAPNKENALGAAKQGQEDLARLQAALAQAQAGLAQAGNEPPHAGGEEHPGPPHPGNHPGQNPANGTHAAQKYQPGGDGDLKLGARTVSSKPASFAGLPPRERAAIEQAQAEKYPEEYGPLVEQYLRNLASESGGK